MGNKKTNKVVYLNLTMSIIKLNVNHLNTPEIYRLHERARTEYMSLSQENHFKYIKSKKMGSNTIILSKRKLECIY